jgi:hypothetical protein
VKYLIAILISTLLIGCGPNDLYPKYRQMKAESIWMLETCEEKAKEPVYAYNGSSAFIRQSCKKPSNTEKWRLEFEHKLTESGWIHKGTDLARRYCLKNTGIVLFIEEYADAQNNTNMHFYYPSSTCR